MSTIQKAVSFLKDIKPKDGVVVVYNNDVDGMSSCAIIKKFLGSIGNDPYIISQPMPPDKNLIRRIQTGIPQKIIFLDMAIDQQPVVIKKLAGIADILIIDHHKISQNLNGKKVVHYNPRFKDTKIYQSTSYCAWKIVSDIMDISDIIWIAATGAVADYDLTWSKDLMKEAEKKYELSQFNKLAAMIESVRVIKTMTCDQLVDVMLHSKGPEPIIKSGDFIEAYQKIENEIESVMADAQVNSERHGDVIFYNIHSQYNLKSVISTKLSEKWEDKLVVIYEKIGSHMNASVRNQKKNIGADRVLRQAIRGIKGGSAGGHDAAGGATLPATDWDIFKAALLAAVEKK